MQLQLQSRMAAGDGSFTGRLKREDCKRTKHDSAFCDWKILIGPNDWEYYLLRKEGAERYRTQNLPNCTSCAGVYELGIAVPRRKAGREASRLDPDYIIPVYVGKSDNVRTRLQQYGREGAHLDNEIVSGSKRAGLFTEAFSRGFSIVYRWAPMNDNKDAERTEARLLDKFDYAWNKGSNGVRRQNDVFRKGEGISRETRLPAFIRKVQLSLEKQKGIRIKACEPLCLENGSDFHDSFKSTAFLPQIFKFGRSQPRIVSVRFGVNGDPDTICGVALGHGSVCRRPPIKGNKRCAEHKGMKINSVHESTSPAEENAPICGFILDSGVPCTRKPFQRNKRCIEHTGRRNRGFISEPMTNNPVLGYRTSSRNDLSSRVDTQHSQIHQSHNIICGVYLNDGSLCTRQPASGRKRCERHKGMRVQGPISIPSVFAGPATKMHGNIDLPSVSYSPTCGATLCNGSFCSRKPSEGNKRCWQHNIDLPSVSYSPTCGATLYNGSFCSRKPSEGNIRCWQHNLDLPSVGYSPTYLPSASYSPTCGATLLNGSFCSRKPSEGNKRCWQHNIGLPSVSYSPTYLPSASYSPTCGATLLNGSFCSRKPSEGNKRCWQHNIDLPSVSYSPTYLPSVSYSPTCGATLRNGSFCSRKPSEGNKRCWQHKGRRI